MEISKLIRMKIPFFCMIAAVSFWFCLVNNGFAGWDTSVSGQVTTNDNVGIGTSTPEELVHIVRETGVGLLIESPSSQNAPSLTFRGTFGGYTGTGSFTWDSNNEWFKITANSGLQLPVGSAYFWGGKSAGFITRYDITGINVYGRDGITLTTDSNNSKVVSIPYGNFQIGDSSFVVNSTGNVGIGTASPTANLHISSYDPNQTALIIEDAVTTGYSISPLRAKLLSNAQYSPTLDLCGNVGCASIQYDSDNERLLFTGGYLKLIIGSGGQQISNPAANELKVSATSKLTLNAGNATTPGNVVITNSNVGIGTSTPNYKLDVAGKINGDEICINGSCQSSWPSSSSSWSSNGGNIYFDTGHVGIGTNAPSSQLHIAEAGSPHIIIQDTDSVMTDSSAAAFLRFYDSAGSQMGYVGDGGGGQNISLVGEAGYSLTLNSDGQRAMTIDTNQNVGIGTTSPTDKVSIVTGAGNADGLGIYEVDGGASGGKLFLGMDGSGDGYLTLTHGNNNEQVQIHSNSITYFNGGNVGIGTNSPDGILELSGSGTAQTIYFSQFRNTSGSADLTFRHSRNTTEGGHTIVQNNDNLGTVSFLGSDGDEFLAAASIRAQVDGTAGDNNMPGRLVFNTTADGSSTATEKMRISSSGNVGIGTTSPSGKLHSKAAGGVGGGFSAPLLRLESGDIADKAWDIYGSNGHGSPSSRFGISLTTMSTSTEDWKLIIDENGNVGIGTTAPNTKLHVLGDGYVDGNFTVTGNIGAKYQDLAEWVMTSESMLPGTVVMIDTEKVDHVAPSDREYNTLVAGVVSPSPGIILGEEAENKAIIAHTGRVKVKVDTSNGAISVGDLLVSSPVKGYAMKADSNKLKPGMLLGKALQPLERGKKGEVLTLITLQ